MDDLWAMKSEDVGLIARAVSLQDFQPLWSWSKKTWREIVEKDCRARGLNTEDAMCCSRWRKQIGMIYDYDECSGWMFLLVPAHPGCPGQFPQSRKTVVCVFVIMIHQCHRWTDRQMTCNRKTTLCIVVHHTVKMAKHFVKILLPFDSPIILVFSHWGALLNSDGFTPNGGAKYKGGNLAILDH